MPAGSWRSCYCLKRAREPTVTAFVAWAVWCVLVQADVSGDPGTSPVDCPFELEGLAALQQRVINETAGFRGIRWGVWRRCRLGRSHALHASGYCAPAFPFPAPLSHDLPCRFPVGPAMQVTGGCCWAGFRWVLLGWVQQMALWVHWQGTCAQETSGRCTSKNTLRKYIHRYERAPRAGTPPHRVGLTAEHKGSHGVPRKCPAFPALLNHLCNHLAAVDRGLRTPSSNIFKTTTSLGRSFPTYTCLLSGEW